MKENLLIIEKILLRATIIGIAIMLISLIFIIPLHDLAFKIHSKLFSITEEQFNIATYWFLGFLKIQVFIMFFIPYISIRMVRTKIKD